MAIQIPRLGAISFLGRWGEYSKPITYLLDMVFSDFADATAPLTSPIVGRAGQLTVVDTGNYAVFSGGRLVLSNVHTAWADPRVYDATARSRVAGLTNFQRTRRISNGFGNVVGLFESTSLNSALMGLRFVSGGAVAAQDDDAPASVGAVVGTFVADTDYDIAVVARNAGGLLIVDGVLLWVMNTDSTTTLYSGFPTANLDGADPSVSILRLADLAANATYPVPALGTRDLDLCTPGTGTGTSSIAAPAGGNTFVHTADTLIKWTQTTIPTDATSTQIRFRSQSPTEYYAVYVYNTGNVILYRFPGVVVLGSSTGIVDGTTMTVEVNNETIKVWADGTLKINYTSAVEYNGSGGTVANIGTGAAIATLTARTLDGVANVGSSNHPGYGLATAVLPGPRAVADTFTHEADCILEFMLDALPSSGPVSILFRIHDVNNYWNVQAQADGSFKLFEYVAGATLRGTAGPGTLSGGERIAIVANGTTIKGYYDTTLAWTYASATNFATKTSGKIDSLGTGGAVSDIISWPLDLASAPNTPEAANVKAAFDKLATP